MPTVIQVKRGTASSWTSANTVLAAGEMGFETDTKKMKVGDGSTAWTSLTYTATDGDITAVVAGTGLSGGSTSGSATLAIDTSVVVDKTTAQTLTNKTLTSPVLTTPSISTMTTTGDILYASAANTPARLGIGSTDQVLKVTAGVPAWSTPAVSTPTFVGCSLYNSTTLSFVNNTETTITYDSEYIDTHGFHDSVNPSRITIPAGYAGKYLISAANRWVQNSNGTRNMGLYVNNNSVVDMMNLPGNAETLSYCFRSLIYILAVGDFIQIRASQTTGATWNMYNRTIEMPFSVQWLGA